MEKLQKLLLIDDDDISNFINYNLLKKLELADEIKVVKNGAEGIKVLEDCFSQTRKSPEIILLDINMPVVDGFQFLKAFHEIDFENRKEVKIIVLTTSSHPKDRDKMEAMGVTHFINKPLTEEKIKEFFDFR